MGQYINAVKLCVRPNFCNICILLCQSEFIKEFSREMATKGSVKLFATIIPNPPFFSQRISHRNVALKHTIDWGWKCPHKYLKLLSSKSHTT